jgi:predicted transposase YdaD
MTQYNSELLQLRYRQAWEKLRIAEMGATWFANKREREANAMRAHITAAQNGRLNGMTAERRVEARTPKRMHRSITIANKMLDEGASMADIAEKLNIKMSSLKRTVQRYGLPRKDLYKK